MKAAVVQKPNTSVVIAERPIRHLQEEAYELGAEYICPGLAPDGTLVTPGGAARAMSR